MNKLKIIGLWIMVIWMIPSCMSPKKLYYFHDQVETKVSLEESGMMEHLKIQKGDRVQIIVTSPDPSVTSYLNPYPNTFSNNTQLGVSGYLVDSLGYIIFPQIGLVKIDGLTTREASLLLIDKLSVHYKDIFVNVNLSGRIFFMNGRQGTSLQMFNERMTIFEALAQSGVQDPYDVKNEVWLVREENGTRNFVKLDLNSKSIFESPYYYLHNNDFIYMKPGRASTILNQSSPARIGLTFSGILLTLILIFRR